MIQRYIKNTLSNLNINFIDVNFYLKGDARSDFPFKVIGVKIEYFAMCHSILRHQLEINIDDNMCCLLCHETFDKEHLKVKM